PVNQSALPDALIYVPSTFGIIVEAKVAAALDLGQLRRHAASAGWNARTYVTIRLTWQSLFRAFQLVKITGTPAFLRDQFLEYLRLIGVAPFDGFKSQDFDHFIGDDPEYRGLLRGRLQEFASLVASNLPSSIRD